VCAATVTVSEQEAFFDFATNINLSKNLISLVSAIRFDNSQDLSVVKGHLGTNFIYALQHAQWDQLGSCGRTDDPLFSLQFGSQKSPRPLSGRTGEWTMGHTLDRSGPISGMDECESSGYGSHEKPYYELLAQDLY
jgi:hypothetical protein